MSELMAMQDADQMGGGASGVPAGMSAGALLRQLRESAGVHIDMLAGALKVPVAKLQALEADHYEVFPDAVFVRALALSICRTLKVDAVPVMALLPQGGPIHLPPDKGINASFKDPGRRLGKAGGSMERPRSRLVAIAVVALLLAALVVALLPLPIGGESKDEPAASVAAPVPAQPSPAEPQAPDTAAVQAAPPAEPVVQPAPVQAPATAEVAEPVAPAAKPEPVEPEAAKAAVVGDVLVISARAQSWVQVRNASGRVVFEKSLAAGERFAAEGSPPWSVVVGKADATDVTVRGQPMDLKAIARENVARFEVK